jgi:uncharacterized coiled-coil protein SlyX
MIYNWQRWEILLQSIVEVDLRGKEVRELTTLIELENRVKKLEERSSIQDETIKRMFDFIQRVIDDQAEKLEERSSIQDEAIKRISDFVQRVLDDQCEKKGGFAENKRDEDEQRKQDSEKQKNNLNSE